jgi:hypothetical protein
MVKENSCKEAENLIFDSENFENWKANIANFEKRQNC